MFPRAISAAPTIALIGVLEGCGAGALRGRHAAVVDSYEKTPFLDDAQPFADAERALGPPDGRTLALGIGASVTLRFFRTIPEGPGPDLRIYEVGPDGAEARVAVSEDGVAFDEFPAIATGSTTEYDLATVGVERALFVRVRGVDNLGTEPGFDLDAVEALH